MYVLLLLACPVTTPDSATEACDDVTVFGDYDGDGFGDDEAVATVSSCDVRPVGYVDVGGDCDDRDAAIAPGATETCNDTDDDCDGTVDEDVATSTFFPDRDGDGYGDDTAPVSACAAPAGTVADGGDCDDTDGGVHPGAVEVCDGVDQDCDGVADAAAPDAPAWYADTDGDGFGDVASVAAACDAPSGYVADASDCDDTDGAVSPAATELCNGTDDDCDGDIDGGAADALTAWPDTDGDGFGDPAAPVATCALTDGLVADATDCDDHAAATFPGAPETCDGADQDCNGTVDDDYALDAATWFADLDGDGYGDPAATTLACSAPAGFVGASTDCDDTESTTSPGEPELCGDAVDNNCDGAMNEGCTLSHCGGIAADETWGTGYTHEVTCPVYVQGSAAPTLTIEDGVTVEMGSGTAIYVGYTEKGRLVADGSTYGITFTSALGSPLPGDWSYLYFGTQDRQSSLTGVTVEYGGQGLTPSIYVWGNAGGYALTLDGVTVRDGAGDGAYFYLGSYPAVTGSTFADNAGYGVESLGAFAVPFTDNVLTGNAEPLYVYGSQVDQLDASNDFTGNTTDLIVVGGDTLSADATWVDVGVPYLVMGSQFVEGSTGPTLTIDAGTEVQFAAGVGIEVARHAAGSLRVAGTAADPVTLTAYNPVGGDWMGLLSWGASTFSVDHADVSYGGNGGAGCIGNTLTTGPAMLVANSTIHHCDGPGFYVTGTGILSVLDSEVYDNQGAGVETAWLGSVAAISGTTFTGNHDEPLVIDASSLPAMGPGNVMTGNGVDEVLLDGGTLTADATLYDYGVPWHVTADVTVASSSRPVLTVEDGVDVQFDPGAGLTIGSPANPGTLDVQGPTTGVRFTTSELTPGAGDWDGLTLTYGSGGSTITGLELEYGGGNGYGGLVLWGSGNEGLDVTLDGLDVHDSTNDGLYGTNAYVSLVDSSIADNAGDGVWVSGYTGGVRSLAGSSILDNGGTALTMDAGSIFAGDLTGLAVSGNGSDVLAFPGYTYSGTHTLHDLGFPYAVLDDLTVSSGSTLTVDPGVELQFADSVSLRVNQGVLAADGTPADPIVFTSAQASPAAGDWDGIYVYNSPTSVLDEVEVRYAGDNGYGGVVCDWADFTLTNAEIAASSTWGLYRRPGCSGSYGTVAYSGNASGTMY